MINECVQTHKYFFVCKISTKYILKHSPDRKFKFPVYPSKHRNTFLQFPDHLRQKCLGYLWSQNKQPTSCETFPSPDECLFMDFMRNLAEDTEPEHDNRQFNPHQLVYIESGLYYSNLSGIETVWRMCTIVVRLLISIFFPKYLINFQNTNPYFKNACVLSYI